jgi:hypothetical protein
VKRYLGYTRDTASHFTTTRMCEAVARL